MYPWPCLHAGYNMTVVSVAGLSSAASDPRSQVLTPSAPIHSQETHISLKTFSLFFLNFLGMNRLKKAGRWLVPKAEKSEDGRDQWGSRTSFVLAAMGGAVGLGNILRYPGQVFHNNGLQW